MLEWRKEEERFASAEGREGERAWWGWYEEVEAEVKEVEVGWDCVKDEEVEGMVGWEREEKVSVRFRLIGERRTSREVEEVEKEERISAVWEERSEYSIFKFGDGWTIYYLAGSGFTFLLHCCC